MHFILREKKKKKSCKKCIFLLFFGWISRASHRSKKIKNVKNFGRLNPSKMSGLSVWLSCIIYEMRLFLQCVEQEIHKVFPVPPLLLPHRLLCVMVRVCLDSSSFLSFCLVSFSRLSGSKPISCIIHCATGVLIYRNWHDAMMFIWYSICEDSK